MTAFAGILALSTVDCQGKKIQTLEAENSALRDLADKLRAERDEAIRVMRYTTELLSRSVDNLDAPAGV